MFEDFLPKWKVGMLLPLPVIDNAAYEFYRLVQDQIMLVMISVGLGEFTAKDVERVFAPIDSMLDKLMERQVDIVVQAGVPLPVLIGLDAHDRLIDHIARRTGKPATSTILGVVEAAKALGLRTVALANKWSEPMNKTLGDFFARGGVEVVGVAAEVTSPADFQKSSSADSIELAHELGRAAGRKFPNADGLYVGGGAWLSQPVCEALEREFQKPAISNQSAQIWDVMHRLGCWKPIKGHGRLLGMA